MLKKYFSIILIFTVLLFISIHVYAGEGLPVNIIQEVNSNGTVDPCKILKVKISALGSGYEEAYNNHIFTVKI